VESTPDPFLVKAERGWHQKGEHDGSHELAEEVAGGSGAQSEELRRGGGAEVLLGELGYTEWPGPWRWHLLQDTFSRLGGRKWNCARCGLDKGSLVECGFLGQLGQKGLGGLLGQHG
jgi:hypothetical protein